MKLSLFLIKLKRSKKIDNGLWRMAHTGLPCLEVVTGLT